MADWIGTRYVIQPEDYSTSMAQRSSTREMIKLGCSIIIALAALITIGRFVSDLSLQWQLAIAGGVLLILAVSTWLWLTSPLEERRIELYREAHDEILDEWSHIKNIADAESPSLVPLETNYKVLYPYQDINKEARKLRNESGVFSRHFWRYFFISRKISEISGHGLSCIDEKDKEGIHNNAKELDSRLKTLVEKLEDDLSVHEVEAV
jgi:hypothetical protein